MNRSFSAPIEERLELARAVTPAQSRKTPVYRWYNLNHSFSRDLVVSLLDELNVSAGNLVLDPFCGAGTTLLSCSEMGIRCLGVDMMPLSTFATKSKMISYDHNKVASDFEHIYPSRQYDFGFEAAAPYLQKSFPHNELTKLLHLRYTIAQMVEPERCFFALALLNILKPVSYTKNDGAFIRFVTDVEPKTLEETFPPQVKMMLEDIEEQADSNGSQTVLRGDARRLPFHDGSINCIITSPPYLNRHDYTRIYALELLFDFLDDNEQLKSLRYKMLRSNVEARNSVKIEDYEPPIRLHRLLKEIGESKLPNRKVLDMIKGYFEDMFGVLREIYRVCKPGAGIAFVVGNSMYGGKLLPVDELLAEIGEKAGLKAKKIMVARYRGNSPQQMKQFGKVSSRESIVIWEK